MKSKRSATNSMASELGPLSEPTLGYELEQSLHSSTSTEFKISSLPIYCMAFGELEHPRNIRTVFGHL
jgi:hypothetical protein